MDKINNDSWDEKQWLHSILLFQEISIKFDEKSIALKEKMIDFYVKSILD